MAEVPPTPAPEADPQPPASHAETLSPPRAKPRWSSRAVVFALFLAFAALEIFKTIHFHAPKQIDVASLHLVTLDGAPIAMQSLAGKAVILNYWAPWCGPCKLELPWLAELQRKHPSDLLILGIVDDPQDYQAAAILARGDGVSYPQLQLTRSILDATGAVDTLPTTFYIGRNGSVLHAINGVVPKLVMEHWVSEAIAAD
jgi:thiol-disulfide isomerase/thioredoxin